MRSQEQLHPYQIARLILPRQKVTVLDASDAQFQAFVTWRCALDISEDAERWSFDDRCRLINQYRASGIDLFAVLGEQEENEQP